MPPETTRANLVIGEGQGKWNDGGILSSLNILLSPEILDIFNLKPTTKCQLIDTREGDGLPSHLLFIVGGDEEEGRVRFDDAVTTIDVNMTMARGEQRVFNVRIGGVVNDINGKKRIMGIRYDRETHITEAVDISLNDQEAASFPDQRILRSPLTPDDDPFKTSAIITKKMLQLTGNPRAKLTWEKQKTDSIWEANYNLVTGLPTGMVNVDKLKNSYSVFARNEELSVVLGSNFIKRIPLYYHAMG